MNILFPLSITLLFETSIYIILNRRSVKLFLIASIMNILLNVSMNLILSITRTPDEFFVVVAVYEVCTLFAESIILWITMRIKYWKTLLFSLLANATSFGVGLILNTYVYPHKTAAIIVCSVFFVLYLLLFAFVFATRKVHDQNNGNDNDGRGKKGEKQEEPSGRAG